MVTQPSHDALVTHSSPLNQETTGDNRPTKLRIKLRIPKNFHEEPVISRLVANHGITVNIAGALLGANARDDGWFDLELRGTQQQIQAALAYLQKLELEIWSQSDLEEDGW